MSKSERLETLLPNQIVSEKTFDVEWFGVEYICDKCGKGQMRFVGTVSFVKPPLYRHVCNACGVSADFDVEYPAVRWRRIDDPMT